MALALVALAWAGPAAAAPRFEVTRLPHSFAQDPSFARDGEVLSAELDSGGIRQIFRSDLRGRRQRCLTCRTVPGPSGLPQDRPQGDWILFENDSAQSPHFGGPGLGGYGSDLYVMGEDGAHPYRLTTTSDPGGGTPYDNFHAYWSPNGRQVVWTHTEAHPLADGGQTWEMLLGDFSVRRGRPSLRNVRVVGRPYGVYETQPWAPDGSGFLFCAAGGYRSPFQATPPGWGHMQLYYMRLYGRGASPAHPLVTQISDNLPAYQEQALFAPDMRSVIMMSNRGATAGSWYDLVVSAAQRTRFDAPDTGSTGTLQFLSDFSSGSGFSSDLYTVDLRSGATRRLTDLGGVVPEFFWDRGYRRIIIGVTGRAGTPTYAGRFMGASATPGAPPRGHPVDMSRVGSQAQPVRDPGPTNNVSLPVTPPAHHAPPLPHAKANGDVTGVPGVVLTYLSLWQSQLTDLGRLAMTSFANPPLG